MSDHLRHYREIWFVDFEFHQPSGELPTVICMVAREFRSGRTIRLWADELINMTSPPFPIGAGTLFIAYYASAEFSCFLSLNWHLPVRVLDLFPEFRCLTNGRPTVAGNGLLGAMAHFGLGAVEAAEKDAMRQLAIRGGAYSSEEKRLLLEYCESDVLSLDRLLTAMLSQIDLPRALFRGRYMCAVASMERAGVPIDGETLGHLRTNWVPIQKKLINKIDVDYGIYEGTTFKRDRFAKWLARNDIPWPRLSSGQLALDDDTFRQMSKSHPSVSPLRELRHALGELRLENLAVGSDSRNRCLLSPFRSRTSRNQPSNSRFVFGPSCWIRGLIKPPPGRAIAYVDWSQQEFAIAGALSGDEAMMQAYLSADPYLTFAKQAGVIPESATKQTHPQRREQFKVLTLAVQYGMKSQALGRALGQSEARARELLNLHMRTYPEYWKWSQAAVDHAMLYGWLETVFGWRIHVGGRVNPRGLANFPMQANGAEMLRMACCLATERGITVCAPVHDALLVEGDVDSIEMVVRETQSAMREAGRVVLNGFELRTDAYIIRSPNRYVDKRGKKMWDTTMSILAEIALEST